MKRIPYVLLGLSVFSITWSAYAGLGAVATGFSDDEVSLAYDVATCAPEVVDGNVKATDRILSELSKKPEFASARLYQSELSRIQALETKERIAAYLSEAGVNPKSNEEIVEFLGSRSPQPKNIEALKKNMGLTGAQSDEVISALTQALVPQR